MEIPSLKLHAEEFEKIQTVLETLLKQFTSASAFLVSRSGQAVAVQGTENSIDQEAISSLAAGNLAAISGLAQLIGEQEFERVIHQGRRRSILLMPVGELALLMLILGNKPENREGLKKMKRITMLLRDLLERRNRGVKEVKAKED